MLPLALLAEEAGVVDDAAGAVLLSLGEGVEGAGEVVVPGVVVAEVDDQPGAAEQAHPLRRRDREVAVVARALVEEQADAAEVTGADRLGAADVGVVAAALDEHPDAGGARAGGADPRLLEVGGAVVVGELRCGQGAELVVAAGGEHQCRGDEAFRSVVRQMALAVGSLDHPAAGEVGIRLLAAACRSGHAGEGLGPALEVDEVAAGVVEELRVAAGVDDEREILCVRRAGYGGHPHHRPDVERLGLEGREPCLELQGALLDRLGAGADGADRRRGQRDLGVDAVAEGLAGCDRGAQPVAGVERLDGPGEQAGEGVGEVRGGELGRGVAGDAEVTREARDRRREVALGEGSRRRGGESRRRYKVVDERIERQPREHRGVDAGECCGRRRRARRCGDRDGDRRPGPGSGRGQGQAGRCGQHQDGAEPPPVIAGADIHGLISRFLAQRDRPPHPYTLRLAPR